MITEQMIYDIIDSIATQAKAVIGAHLEKQELVETLKQSAKDWDEAGEKAVKVFRDLEDNLRKYCEKHCTDITAGDDYAESCEQTEFAVGDEIVFFGNGCAVKDRISRVLVETENGYQVYVDDAFRDMDGLVERLKEDVHG